jgi:outer membrane protein OmpA-like peptidoglycan-associated protein
VQARVAIPPVVPPANGAVRVPGTPPVQDPGAAAKAVVTPTQVPKAAIVPPAGPAVAPVVRTGVPPPAGVPAVAKAAAPPTGPANLEQVRSARVVTTGARGASIIQEPGNRTIIRQDNRTIVYRDERTVVQNFYPGARTVPLPNGISQTTYVRPDGVRVISEFDGSGRLIRRYGQASGGREIVYVDNRKFYRNVAIGVGVAAVGIGIALALAPPVIAMPRERYIVDYDRADDDIIYETLIAPPIERLERDYSLEEIRYSQALRDRMRRIDLDAVTFDTGSFEVTPDQFSKLERVARGLRRAIEHNPAEMYLIEGHTDAVGTPEDNLSLSDRRAEAVARVLVEVFNVPMENLVTQGYGEQNLKVETQGPERANRRVAIRRITPLMGRG